MEKPNTKLQWLFAGLVGLLVARYLGRGVSALIDGRMWLASKTSPPTLLTGDAAALMGLATIGLGLIVGAALAAFFKIDRRVWATMGAVGALCALVCGGGALLVS